MTAPPRAFSGSKKCMGPALNAISVNQEYPVVHLPTAMNGHKAPRAWIGKGCTVQALLQTCRHELNHEARVPNDLASFMALTWRDDDGHKVGTITGDQIRVIVDLNKSHFEYVTLLKRMPDGQEVPMLCVSATIKGQRRHPTYDPSGMPVDLLGNAGIDERDSLRGRHRRPLDTGGFPMLPVPDILPQLADIV